MTLAAGLWLCAGLMAATLGAGVLAGFAVDAALQMRDLARAGLKYEAAPSA